MLSVSTDSSSPGVFEAPADGLYLLILEGTFVSSGNQGAFLVKDSVSGETLASIGGNGPLYAATSAIIRLVRTQQVFIYATVASATGGCTVSLSGARLADEVPPAE